MLAAICTKSRIQAHVEAIIDSTASTTHTQINFTQLESLSRIRRLIITISQGQTQSNTEVTVCSWRDWI